MSEEILTEIVEETVEETEVLEEEITTEETEEIIELPPQRVNPFCVISKNTFGEYAVRDIQTNSGWSANPYGEEYAVVPDEMVTDILETKGFVDIELNEDGTEVVSFTALEVPDIPVPEPEPTPTDESVWDEMANAITEGVNEV